MVLVGLLHQSSPGGGGLAACGMGGTRSGVRAAVAAAGAAAAAVAARLAATALVAALTVLPRLPAPKQPGPPPTPPCPTQEQGVCAEGVLPAPSRVLQHASDPRHLAWTSPWQQALTGWAGGKRHGQMKSMGGLAGLGREKTMWKS